MKRMIKLYKTYIYILLFFVTIMPLCSFSVSAAGNSAVFSGGDGTEGNPYQIATPEQLNEVRNHLNAYFIQTADIDLTEATAEGGIFYNDGSGWAPIGTDYSTAFTGNYNGGGFCIIGLKSMQNNTEAQYIGLFGYNSGVIRNLGMVDGVVSILNPNARLYAGGVAGRNYHGTIINCYNTGSLSVSDSVSTYVGGIVGENEVGSITNCYNMGTVSGSYYAGGIAGKNNDTITSCYNAGAVSGLGTSYIYVGGITGGSGAITNCYNTGVITAENEDGTVYAGGIAGYGGTITNCYNTGIVSSSPSARYSYAGGIVGYSGTITNCYYNAPNIKTESGTALTLDELKQQESYAGFDFETIWEFDTKSYYPFPVLRGMTISEQKEENTTDFAGGTGCLENPYRVSTAEQLHHVRDYLNAYFIQTADIDLTAATAEGGAFYNDGSGWEPIGTDANTPFGGNYNGGGHYIIGLKSKQSDSGTQYAGLFGYNDGVVQNLGMYNGVVSDSFYAGGIVGYNSGAIVNCYNTSSVLGSYAGGIAGDNSGIIANCYNTGAVSASSAIAGGIAGMNNGTITNCYFYDAPNLYTTYTNAVGTPLSLDALKQQRSYVGFDFESVWMLDTNSYYPFPIFQGMTPPQQEKENITEFAGGTGRLENPYLISTTKQLNNVRNYLNAYFIQTADIDLTAATAEGGTFYNNGSGWLPIGADYNTPFAGNYNGGGNRIIGLKSNQSDSGIQYGGLFGYNEGVIQNLGIGGGTVSSYGCAGGVAGHNGGAIANCYNTGAVLSLSSSAGGISGINSIANITNCYNTGAVSASSYAGGIVGSNDNSSIENCYNTGAISTDSLSARGGIEGYQRGVSIKCYYYNAPNIKTKSGSALMLDELKQQKSYVGFDFETVWEFESGYPFPILRGVTPPQQEKENITEFAGGTGRLENPYKVSTAEQLNHVRNYLGAYFIQTADIDLTALTVEGGAFYNDGIGWEPIGTDANTPFGGNYNGGGHCIIGLKSCQSCSEEFYVGLFGCNNGVIQNLGIENGVVSVSYFSSASSVTVLSSYAGGIAGRNNGSIINCYNTGTVSSLSYSDFQSYAGGIAGSNSGSIENCYNTGMVSDSSTYVGAAGGIAGYNSSGNITNCYNTGTVLSSASASNSILYAGGIVGKGWYGSVTNCCNTGMVSSSASNSLSYVGGIAGEQRADSTIANCYNAGEITAESNTKTVRAGGIAGYSEYSVSYGKATLTNVFNTGKVTARTNGTDRYAYAGGLAGYTNGGNISYGYSLSEVQGSPQYTGKVVGSNQDGTLSRLYFIGTNTDLGIGNEENSEDKVEFKSAEQMKRQATFVGFDFNTVWSISPDKNGGYPFLQGLPIPEDIPTVPEEPNETNASISLSEKSYDEATGTYHLTIIVNNQGEETIAGTLFVAAYAGGRFIGARKYPVTGLTPGQTHTVPAEITTNKKATQLKIFFWDMTTLKPLSNAMGAEG